MPIAPLERNDRRTFPKLNQVIARANLVDGLVASVGAATAAANQAYAQARAVLLAMDGKAGVDVTAQLAALKADRTALTALGAQVDALAALGLTRRFDFSAAEGRPGDGGLAFTVVDAVAGLSGRREALPAIDPGLMATGDNGEVVRLRAPSVLGQRRHLAIEPGRVYRVRAVFRRRANAADPANDTVRVGIAWLDQNLNVLTGSPTVVEDVDDLKKLNGRRSAQATLASAAGFGIDHVAPYGARYARAYIQSFSPTAVTDIEVIALEDVTNGVVPSELSIGQEARLAALESLDLGDRVDQIEGDLGTPRTATFERRADAISATIAASVTTVRLLGYADPGDGGEALYRRVVGAPAHAGKFQSADGAWWSLSQSLVNKAQFGGDQAAADAYLLAALPALPNYRWKASATGADITISEKIGRLIDLDDYRLVIDADDGAAFTRAQAALGLNGGKVNLPSREIVIAAAQVVLNRPIWWCGVGAAEDPNATGGTRIRLTNAGLQPFLVEDLGSRGARFSDLTICQDHFGSSMVPTNYPVVFDVQSTFGAFDLINIHCPGINKLINVFNAGRIELRCIYGQFYRNLATFDKTLDKIWVDEIDAWPYYTSLDEVMAFTQTNCDVFILKRCDTPFFGDVSTYGVRSSFRFSGSAEGITTRAKINSLQGDATARGIWVDPLAVAGVGDGVTLQYGSLDIQCEDWNNRGFGLPGSDAIVIEAADAYIEGGPIRAELAGRNGVRITAPRCQIRASGGWFRTWDAKASPTTSVSALYVKGGAGGASLVAFAMPPRFDPWAGQAIVNADCDGIIDLGTRAQFDYTADRTVLYPGHPAGGTHVLMGTGEGNHAGLGVDGATLFRVDREFDGDDQAALVAQLLMRLTMAGDIELVAEGTDGGNIFLVPRTGKHTQFGGDMSWNGSHLVLGGYHLWFDSLARMRIKAGAPGSDTDGLVVGTQS